MSNLKTLIDENQKTFIGAAFHYRFSGIVTIIIGAFCGVVGLFITVITFGLGIGAGVLYWALATLYIFLGIFLINAAKPLKEIAYSDEITQDEYNLRTLESLKQTKKYFKISNIVLIVSLIIALIFMIIGAVAFGSLLSNPDFQKSLSNPTPGYSIPQKDSQNMN